MFIAAFTREIYLFLDMFHIEIDCEKWMRAFKIGIFLFLKNVRRAVFAARHSVRPVCTRQGLTMHSIYVQTPASNACKKRTQKRIQSMGAFMLENINSVNLAHRSCEHKSDFAHFMFHLPHDVWHCGTHELI